MAKTNWHAKLISLFSKPKNSHRTTSRTTNRSPNRVVTRTTSRTTNRSPNRAVTRTTSRTTNRSPNRAATRTTSRTTVRSPPRTTNRPIIRSTQKTYSRTKSSLKSVHRHSPTHKSAVTKRKYNLYKLKPKSTIPFKEDFKCIFCFELPKLPADEKRGIIICPHCGQPAHADEFKNWLKSSRLCSRCDRPISINFIQNIEIIPTGVYLRAMRVLMKKKR